MLHMQTHFPAKSKKRWSTMTVTMNEEYFDIVICGCGPTGALLSANLSRLGIRHLVLEREDSITTDPRGIALDEDGIRIVQGVGKYEQLFTDVGKGKLRNLLYVIPVGTDIQLSYGHVPFHRRRARPSREAVPTN